MILACTVPIPVPLFFSSSKRFSRTFLLLPIFCLMPFCWLANLQGHNQMTAQRCVQIVAHIHNCVQTHLSAMATASGSVGGIMKQTAGAVSLRPAPSFTSHLVPLFWSKVYRSPRTICPCARSHLRFVICYQTTYTVRIQKKFIQSNN